MICTEKNRDEFEKYILQISRTNIPYKSKKILQNIMCEFLLLKNITIVKNILNKYNISYYFLTINENLLQLLYLQEYENSTEFNVYNTLEYKKYTLFKSEAEPYLINESITKKYEQYFISKSARKEDIKYFPDLESNSYAYFIFDSSDKQIVYCILKDYFNLEIIAQDILIKNDEYDIDNLFYFEVCDNYYACTGNYLSYKILCILNSCNISYCLINDSHGKISLRNEMKLEHNYGFNYRINLKSPFRSTWEANIARILNYNGIKWEYEKTSFIRYVPDHPEKTPRGYYFPDFFLDHNKIIEIKGFWDSESRNKALEFTKHFTDFSYFIVDQDMYYNLKTKYKSNIPEWEEDGMISVENETLQIVGLTVGMRKQTFKTLKVGDKVILQRDSQNTYDSNAIMALTIDKKEIGFISADWAVIYASKIDMGMTFDVEISSIEPKVINIKVKRNNLEIEIIYDFFKVQDSKIINGRCTDNGYQRLDLDK